MVVMRMYEPNRGNNGKRKIRFWGTWQSALKWYVGDQTKVTTSWILHLCSTYGRLHLFPFIAVKQHCTNDEFGNLCETFPCIVMPDWFHVDGAELNWHIKEDCTVKNHHMAGVNLQQQMETSLIQRRTRCHGWMGSTRAVCFWVSNHSMKIGCHSWELSWFLQAFQRNGGTVPHINHWTLSSTASSVDNAALLCESRTISPWTLIYLV